MKTINYIRLCVVIMLSIAVQGWSQISGLQFEQISYDEDFSPSMISDITQSKKGFIWIGTENGLFRYDGYSFYRYLRDKDPEGSLSNSHVNVIFEDSHQNLWIGTNHGVNLLKKSSNGFIQVDVTKSKGGRNYITSFVEDSSHNIWIGTFGGVKRYNAESNLLENIQIDSNFILNQSRVLSLFYDKDYGVLVGTSEGTRCFDPVTFEIKLLPDALMRNQEFLKAKVWKIVKEANGDLWFATETRGVYHYIAAKDIVDQFTHNFANENSIASNWVNDIIVIDENTLWFATKDGLSVYDKNNTKFTRYHHNPLNNSSITDNDVKCFLKDRLGCLWLGTTAGGINFYNKADSNFIKIGETIESGFGLNNTLASALLKENDHIFWVGTEGGGLNYIDIKRNISNTYNIDINDRKMTRDIITALVSKDANTLLCGTFNGLFQFDKRSKIFKQIPLSADGTITDERPITSLIMDNGEIWVGTDGNGVKRVLKNGTVENYRHDESLASLSDNFVMDLENRPNGIWISTQNGLNYFDKEQKKITKIYRTNSAKPIGNNSLTTLFTDSKNRLWVGGDYDGLFYLDENTDSFLILNKSKGFTDAAIKSIAEDSNGNLWVSSEDLLYKLTIKSEKVKLTEQDIKITKYAAKDGVTVKQFESNSSLKLNENQLVFGASKGILLFNPDNVLKSPNTSEIVFTKLIVNNEHIEYGNQSTILASPISEASEIIINYDQGYIGLEFSSLNFINPKKSKYAYKLDDALHTDEWHTTGTQNRINLSNMAPGNYKLSIRSTNEDGGWNPNIKTLKIIVLPPWWKTWWAYSGYALIILLLGYIVYRFVNNRIKLKRSLFLEHLENERKQEMFNMQLNFFTNVSHEIRTPLTLIKGPVEELLAEKSDPKTEGKLKTIQQNSDRLLKLVNELLDFRKAEKGHMRIYYEKQDIVSFCFEIFETFKGIAVEKNIEYKFVLNSNAIQVYFDKNQLEKVIFNLLSNAFKFTKRNGKIVFAVEQGSPSENKVYIKVKDNGIGIPDSSKSNIFERFFQVDDSSLNKMGSGIGLALSKNIIELHKGDIAIADEKETWAKTVFQISLLLGDKHLSKDQIIENDAATKTYVIDADNIPSIITDEAVVPEEENYEEDILHKKSVMVVEDSEEVRQFIVNILKEEYTIMEFPNGKEAVAHMEQEIPDIIISDVMMPEMDGLELCRYVKANESTNHIPVILLTAKASTDNEIEGLTTGADAYISKPFSIKVLKLSVANLLTSKEILRQKYSGSFILNSDPDKLTTPEEVFIKKLMNVIEENLENPDFDVNMLVNEIGMSRTVLYKKVNTLTNHSVASLIKHIRLKKASEIILNTTYSVSEVAFMVGFNDRKHFSREFKKIYHVSPTVYKSSKTEISS